MTARAVECKTAFSTSASISGWTLCSIGMLVFNKLAVQAIPLPCTLVALQMAFTVLVLGIFCRTSLYIGSVWDVVRWCAVVPFFVGMLLTSMYALHAAPMSLVVTFRALSPCVAMAVERFYPTPPRVTVGSLATLVVIIIGALLYAKDVSYESSSAWHAIGWVLLNTLCSIGDRLLQSLFLQRSQSPVDISKTGVALLNNLLGFVCLFFVLLYMQEHHQWHEVLIRLDFKARVWVTMSCFVSVGISFSGIVVQALISATSFLVLINANKFAVIIIEMAFLTSSKAPLTHLQICGSMLTVFGSVLYGFSKDGAFLTSALSAPSEKTKLQRSLTRDATTVDEKAVV